MPRSKTMRGYPERFVTILRGVTDYGGREFVFPKGFGGLHDVSLRTTYQSFLKAVRNDAKANPGDPMLEDLAERSHHAIVRIRNGQVTIEDRRRDRVAMELETLCAERGLRDPWEQEMLDMGVDPRTGMPINPALAGLPAPGNPSQPPLGGLPDTSAPSQSSESAEQREGEGIGGTPSIEPTQELTPAQIAARRFLGNRAKD